MNLSSIETYTVNINDVTAPTITCSADQSQNTDVGSCDAVVSVVAPAVSDVGGSYQGYSLSFDGINDYVEVASFPDPSPMPSFSIEAWIYTNDNAKLGQRVFCDDENDISGYALSIGDAGAGSIRFYSRGMANILLDATGVISNNTWHHVVGVADIANSMRYIYVDGVEVANMADPGTWGTDAGPASIGGETDLGETANRFFGKIRDVSIWTKALSPAEVLTHSDFCTELNGSEADLFSFWNFNDGSGLTADDIAVGNHDGTLTNMDASTDWIHQFIPCIDAINDYNGTTDASDTYPVGTTTITWTATDFSGNSSQCTQDIIIADNEIPTAICQDITVNLDAGGNASITATQIDNGSTDVCGIASLSVSPNSFTCANLGANTVTLTVTDNHSNANTCSATVTIVDNTAPTFTKPVDITIYKDVSCNYDASVSATGDVTDEADNCGVGQATYTDVVNSTNPCSIIITRTWALTDNEGNPASNQVQIITVEDNTLPTFTKPADITIYKDASCNYDASVSATGDVIDEADNCTVGNASYTDVVDNTNPCAIEITRTWALTDDCGNVALTQDQIITVEDNTPPTASNPGNISVQCIGDVPAANVSVITDEVDNCTANPVVAHLSDVSDNNSCPETITRTYTVADDCGNMISVPQLIIIRDTQIPVINGAITTTTVEGCDNTAVPVAETTVAGIEGLAGSPAISDNCTTDGNLTVTHSDSQSGSCPIVITRTYTLTDECNNLNTIVHTINVDDTTVPTASNPLPQNVQCFSDIVAPNITVVTDEADNCTVAPVVALQSLLMIIFHQQTVTDSRPPEAICKDITVYLDANGDVSITGADIDDGSFDNGSIASLIQAIIP